MKTPVKELSAKFGLREKDIKILIKFGAMALRHAFVSDGEKGLKEFIRANLNL